MKKLFALILTLVFCSTALAANVKDRMTYEGPVTFKGAVTTSGTVTTSGAASFTGNVTLGDAAADTVTVNGTIQGASPLVFEGATANAYETTIAVTDPTADRTITLPDATGVPILATALPDVANAVSGTSNGLVFEGATANAMETTLTVIDPTGDNTVSLPDETGTVALIAGKGSNKTVTAGSGTNTLTQADCGKVYTAAADGDAVFNLPAKMAGCEYVFINIGAAGNNLLTINPDNADSIFGTVTLAASVVVISGAAGDAVSNTKSSSQKGDSMTIIATSAGWMITSSTGIWADIN